jgi:hypothetical protein
MRCLQLVAQCTGAAVRDTDTELSFIIALLGERSRLARIHCATGGREGRPGCAYRLARVLDVHIASHVY